MTILRQEVWFGVAAAFLNVEKLKIQAYSSQVGIIYLGFNDTMQVVHNRQSHAWYAIEKDSWNRLS